EPGDIVPADFQDRRHRKGHERGVCANPLKPCRKRKMPAQSGGTHKEHRHEHSESTCRAQANAKKNTRQGVHTSIISYVLVKYNRSAHFVSRISFAKIQSLSRTKFQIKHVLARCHFLDRSRQLKSRR